MNILLVEPFMTGSHASWANGLKKHSRHQIEIISLPGRHWKWRMHGSAVSLALEFAQLKKSFLPDLIIASDMLDLSTFIGLCHKDINNIPIAVYFHENQLSYPWSPDDEDVQKGRDFHYGFMNWTTALAADVLWFNSRYNMDSFYSGVRTMLKAMPDNRHLDLVDKVKAKSTTIPLGINLEDFSMPVSNKDLSIPVILWNHRWEYDKNPEDFFESLRYLQEKGIHFKLIVCGEAYEKYPVIFDRVKTDFSNELIHFGYAESREQYGKLLKTANLIPVTNKQEFFGQSVMEAIAAGCFPILPDALAYPEHIPDSIKQTVLYRNNGEFKEKLLSSCSQLSNLKEITDALQNVALQYDWQSMIDQYDDTFSDCVR